jgi:CBS domain containing-hemolysin-like protein
MASRNPADFALTVAPINYLLIQALYPVTRCIDKTIRMFATSDKGNALRYVSADEIEALVDMGRQQTTIEEDMAKHIKKMIAFHDTTVQEIITPRVRIEAIKASATVSEAMLKMKEYSHSRIPVFSKRIDDIEWIVSHRELSMYLEQGLQDRTLAELPLKKALKIPLTMPIDKVIDVFKTDRRQMAVVMDEYGGVE